MFSNCYITLSLNKKSDNKLFIHSYVSRSYTLANPDAHEVGSPTLGPGAQVYRALSFNILTLFLKVRRALEKVNCILPYDS